MPEEQEQVVEDVAPETTVEDATPETPAEEPQEVVGDYSPDWLDESEPEPEQQGPSPEEIAAYQRQMAMQQQNQYAPPPPPQTQSDLDRLVADTRGTIADLTTPYIQQTVGSMMQQHVAPQLENMRRLVEGQRQVDTIESKRAVAKMYDSFNKDEAFVGNESVRREVENTLKGLRAQALMAAANGNRLGLQMLNDPNLADITLYAAKKVAGARAGASSPVSAPHTERAAPAATSKKSYADALDPDTQEGLKRYYGDNWRERYNNSVAEDEKNKG